MSASPAVPRVPLLTLSCWNGQESKIYQGHPRGAVHSQASCSLIHRGLNVPSSASPASQMYQACIYKVFCIYKCTMAAFTQLAHELVFPGLTLDGASSFSFVPASVLTLDFAATLPGAQSLGLWTQDGRDAEPWGHSSLPPAHPSPTPVERRGQDRSTGFECKAQRLRAISQRGSSVSQT